MWFPIIQHQDSVIEARHSDLRWHFRRRVTESEAAGFVVTTRSEPTTGLGWLLEEGGWGPIEGLHPAARTVMRGAHAYALREGRAPWWSDQVECVCLEDLIPFEELPEHEELCPLRFPWNAHVVHHREMLDAWRARNLNILPVVDLEAFVMAGTVGEDVDRARVRYFETLEDMTRDGVPGPTAEFARFEPSACRSRSQTGSAMVATSLVCDAWHWGLTLGDEEAIVLPPGIGAELAWRHGSCVTERHRTLLCDDVLMLAKALRHVPDPREPFAVLVHGNCVFRARWRLGLWEWSASYTTQTPGFWRRGDITELMRSDLLHLGPPTYLHPAVSLRVRDAFELAVSKRGHAFAEDAIWLELLARADEGCMACS